MKHSIKNNVSTNKLVLIYGAILGFLTIAVSLFSYLSGQYTDQNLYHATILFLITFFSIGAGIVHFKKLNSHITLIKAFKIGIAISLLGGFIAILWKVLLLHVIDPDIIEQLKENQYKDTVQSYTTLSKENIEQKVAITERSTSPIRMITLALLSDLISGTIISLVISLFIRKKKKESLT